MKRHLFGLSTLILILTACTIEADWERFLGVNEADYERMEWLEDMEFGPNNQLLVASLSNRIGAVDDRSETLLLTSLNTQGNTLWEKRYNIGLTKAVPDVEAFNNGWLIAINNQVDEEQESRLIAIDGQGNITWSTTLTEGKIRDITTSDSLAFITGKDTYVYNTNGDLQAVVDHGDNWSWKVKPVNNGFVVSTLSYVARYDIQGNQLWQEPHTEALSYPSDLVINNNSVTLVQESDYFGNTALVKQMDLYTGSVIWSRSITQPSRGETSLHGSPRIRATGNDYIIALSNTYNRKLVRLNQSGAIQWSEENGEGIIRDMELFSSGDIAITGDGITQKFSNNGDLIATASTPSSAMDTTGALEILGNDVYVATSIADPERTLVAYVARYRE